MTENSLDAGIYIQQPLQLAICFQKKQVLRHDCQEGTSGRNHPCAQLWEVAADVLTVVFVTISIYVPEFIKWVFHTLTYRQLTGKFCDSAGRTQLPFIYLGISYHSFELGGMWWSGWSHRCFCQGLSRLVPSVSVRGKGLLKEYALWSEKFNQRLIFHAPMNASDCWRQKLNMLEVNASSICVSAFPLLLTAFFFFFFSVKPEEVGLSLRPPSGVFLIAKNSAWHCFQLPMSRT